MPLGKICSRRGGEICTDCGTTCRLDNRRRADKSRAHGLTRARWRRLRKAALERDQHRCRFGLPGCTGKATTVHLRPELGGDHQAAALDDCLSACRHCHGVVDGGRANPSRI